MEKRGFLPDAILKEKALEIFQTHMKIMPFEEPNQNQDNKSSNGWLYRFTKIHDLSLKQCSGEAFNVKNLKIKAE